MTRVEELTADPSANSTIYCPGTKGATFPHAPVAEVEATATARADLLKNDIVGIEARQRKQTITQSFLIAQAQVRIPIAAMLRIL
jgi:hypothetical protein